ncbi:hypothetical protein NEDG_01631 [Nematocida displodere]|uniref:Uncharacterized protein n=1 Tax=Nematocida displodere TaxID=1805483 RepID=A0A177EH68_9MICR|nr:hypothetical protein NEDG_01631 [Nematocida displodere]
MRTLAETAKDKHRIFSTLRSDMNTKDLFGVINVAALSMPSLDEGSFPDEILELISARRESVMQKIRAAVNIQEDSEASDEQGEGGAGGRKKARLQVAIEDTKTTIRMISLEIERLQVQTGARCVEECNRMLAELEKVKTKILNQKETLKTSYLVISIAVVAFSVILFNLIKT